MTYMAHANAILTERECLIANHKVLYYCDVW